MDLNKLIDKLGIQIGVKELYSVATNYFVSDCHFIPFKEAYQDNSDVIIQSLESYILDERRKEIPWRTLKVDRSEYNYLEFLKLLKIGEKVPLEKKSLLIGAYAFTRSISHLDATRIYEEWYDHEWDKFELLLSVYKQIHLRKEDVPISSIDEMKIDEGLIASMKSRSVKSLEIALSSYKVFDESWNATVLNKSEPDQTRLRRLYKLINTMLCERGNTLDLIVLPELSITDYSLRLISEQLRNSKIALVSGLDYMIDRKRTIVRNRLAYVLPIEIFGKTIHVQIIQDKVIPAIHEGNELWKLSKLKMDAKIRRKFLVKHREVLLSSLICNEFLNIDYRYKLRGQIDALILLAWNQDLETYQSLVEATANDLHCFIIQVNNRLYGDTRIRAPFKQSYKRDIARIRGGEDDYYIVAKIDVQSLRLYQMNYISPTDNHALFKPVPTGFKINMDKRLK